MLPVLKINPVQLHVGRIRIDVLRLDAFDFISGGNKLFKLQFNIKEAKTLGFKTIATMGGAYSNHIAATARACRDHDITSVGIIRGEETDQLNVTLSRAKDDGMELHYISREEFRLYRDIRYMQNNFPDCYCIPEGGSNENGVKGCETILTEITAPYDVIAMACGTGATLAGVTRSLRENQRALGISVLKECVAVDAGIRQWLTDEKQGKYILNGSYHFGGYAKTKPELLAFVERFNSDNEFRIEPVYTGKLFYALEDLANNGVLSSGLKVLALHTGGLQYLPYEAEKINFVTDNLMKLR
ncbi:MAG: pyridoxal-phosphate dependent enzyme [Bacteroidota bacterium]